MQTVLKVYYVPQNNLTSKKKIHKLSIKTVTKYHLVSEQAFSRNLIVLCGIRTHSPQRGGSDNVAA